MRFNLSFILPVIATTCYLHLPDLTSASSITAGSTSDGSIDGKEEGGSGYPRGLSKGAKLFDATGRRASTSDGKNTTWAQECNALEGNNDADWFGSSVEMADSGHIIAVGASLADPDGRTDAGLVRVYKKDINAYPNCWAQVGPDITNESLSGGKNLGSSLDITEEGNRLVAGGLDFFQIYEAEGMDPTKWTLIFEQKDPKSRENWVYDVAISDDGKTVAVGYPYASSNKGKVSIYGEDDNGWILMQDIHGGTNDFVPDWLGISLSLSAAGDLLVVGAPSLSSSGTPGRARIFYKIAPMEWQQRGDDLIGSDPGGNFGYTVSMAGSGQRFSVGTSNDDTKFREGGSIRVFDSESLVQVGSTIFGSFRYSRCGFNLSLDFEGKRLAASCRYRDIHDNIQQAVIFENTDDSSDSDWEKLGEAFGGDNGGGGSKISIGRDGKSVIFGSWYHNNKGKAAVFIELVPSSEPSSKPTSEPSMKPSEMPSFEPSSQPSMTPTLHPSSGPSENPSVSSDPSPVPSPHPSLDPICIDSPIEAKLETIGGDFIPFFCEWIAMGRQGSSSYSCNKSGALASHCPKACQACKKFRCRDSKATFMYGSKERKCSWIRNMKNTKRLKFCKKHRIGKTCRASCGYCGQL